jgi:hypothetical protein
MLSRPTSTVVRAEDGALALANGLWVLGEVLMTLSCILGFRRDYRKAMTDKVWGPLAICVLRPQ